MLINVWLIVFLWDLFIASLYGWDYYVRINTIFAFYGYIDF